MSSEITADHIGKMIRVRHDEEFPWLEREYVGREVNRGGHVCKYPCDYEDSYKYQLSDFPYAEPIPEPRELKATDLIGWYCKCHESSVGPVLVMEDCISTSAVHWHKLDNSKLKYWRFTKDPFLPLDQWLNLSEVK